jgi:microcystin-dependent protein
MAEPFLSEIRLFSFNFAPKGWALCNGQLLPINQNQALFSLLGTTFGGNGQTNFAIPDMRGRTPIHVGAGHINGERAGEQAHTLTLGETPTHIHVVSGSSEDANDLIPASNRIAGFNNGYRSASNQLQAIHPATIGNTGGSQAHQNMMPFLTLTFCIALQGIFPSPN